MKRRKEEKIYCLSVKALTERCCCCIVETLRRESFKSRLKTLSRNVHTNRYEIVHTLTLQKICIGVVG
jgi:hypothetical protein